ncbi:MAG: hypothetical protein WBW71_01160 [Bacteroidota bacterium]
MPDACPPLLRPGILGGIPDIVTKKTYACNARSGCLDNDKGYFSVAMSAATIIYLAHQVK